MSNVAVLIFVESRYKVNRKRLKKTVNDFAGEQGLQSLSEISIAIVGDRKMRQLYKKYKGEDRTTNVLSFPLSEGGVSVMPSDKVRLGDIVLSYPQIIREAAGEEVLVDEKIDELVRHGMTHLLGLHHE